MYIKNKRTLLDDNTKLWRYMSYPKFVDIIKTSELYFCRVDCFDDMLEATQPKGNEFFAESTENPWQLFELQCISKQLEIYKNMTFACCWHVCESENVDMWNSYATKEGNKVITIQTDYKSLTESFITDRVLTDVRMKYIDYQKDFINYFMPDFWELISAKDKKYLFENELRVITREEEYPQFDADTMTMDFKPSFCKHTGERIPVDLSVLIKKVYVCPNSDDAFYCNVEKTMFEHAVKAPVEISQL